MSKKDLIDAIEVKASCPESWNEMHGNDQVRFCSHCAHEVNNLSEMTRKEALRLVRRSGGSLCVRYINDPKTNRPLFSENLYKIKRRAPALAAGVMTASIGLSTAAYAQSPPARPPLFLPQLRAGVDAREKKPVSDSETVTTSGTVRGPDGVIPGATIVIINLQTSKELTLTTDGGGSYKISAMPAGSYSIKVSAAGFETSDFETLLMPNGGDATLNVTMKPEAATEVITLMKTGAIIISSHDVRDPLSKAVQNDDSEETKNILANNANVNVKERNYEGATPLFIAVENGNTGIAEMLLNLGARVNARDKNRRTPIMRIDADGSAGLVDLLVRHGARLDLTDNNGNTALILATADQPDVSVIKALLDAGADVNHRNNAGETALMKAAGNDDLEAVRMLILAGADVNLTNRNGDTAWDIATDPGVTELIESYGGMSGDPEETGAPGPLDSM